MMDLEQGQVEARKYPHLYNNNGNQKKTEQRQNYKLDAPL